MLSLLKTLRKSLRSSHRTSPSRYEHAAESSTRPPQSGPPLRESSTRASGRWRHLELREQLGEGAWGKVYRAYDPALDQEFALKLLDQEEGFEEARLLVRLHHPSIVGVFGVNREE